MSTMFRKSSEVRKPTACLREPVPSSVVTWLSLDFICSPSHHVTRPFLKVRPDAELQPTRVRQNPKIPSPARFGWFDCRPSRRRRSPSTSMELSLFFLIFSWFNSGFSAFRSWKSEMASRSVEHKATAS